MRHKKLTPIGSFTRDQIIKNSLALSLAFIVISFLALLVSYSDLPPVVPFFYSVVHGEQQLASKQFLYLLPITNLTFFVSHFWLANINFSTDRMFARVIATTSILISFLFTVALLHIIIIVS